ncbi:MAG TPA: sensor domain-containing diguanylate cyclase [Thermoanaerobaculia bacterium]|jgi:diguanylate cyclase (GGDEF)-like protein|nr:sensor domain-containing diguanylate cyclase [Thermoanaerobaculia bacterium]
MIEAALPGNEQARLEALHGLGVFYTPAEERFDRITRLACRLLDAPIAMVTLIDATCQWFKSKQGTLGSEDPRTVSFCAHAILQEGTMVVPNALLDPRFADNPLVLGEPFIRFYAGHPLKVDGNQVGTLCIIDRRPREIGPADLAVLRDLAALIDNEIRVEALSQVQLDLIRERDAMHRKAMLDSLTHLWNRQAILDVLERELARSRRTGEPVAVLMADVDHFKTINDTHGHLAGDAALQEVARRLRAAVRPYDAIGRYGGEEFLIVLSSCGTDAASKIGEKIRSRVGLAPIELATVRLPVTMSLGIAASDATGMDPLALIAAADAALYRAKAAGRDRVELSM